MDQHLRSKPAPSGGMEGDAIDFLLRSAIPALHENGRIAAALNLDQ